MNVDQVRAANLAVQAAATGLRSGESISFGVTTPGFTDRYLRHSASLGVTSPVSSSADALTRQDSTFRARPGLAGSGCWSFESRNLPGRYLRHSSSRVRLDASDGSALFDRISG